MRAHRRASKVTHADVYMLPSLQVGQETFRYFDSTKDQAIRFKVMTTEANDKACSLDDLQAK